MTQPPYVPPRDDEGTTSSNPTWPAAQNTPVYDYSSASSEPTYGDSLDESVSSVSVGSGYDSTQSSTDVAKDQAAGVKNTAVEQGQQVAGVAKEQAGAVKDTAVGEAQHVAGVAKEQAGAVKDTAVASGQQVAEVAKEQVGNITAEASGQFRDLLDQGRTELSSQLGSQKQRLGALVHSFADELGTMASSSKNAGPLTDLAKQGSRRIGELAHYIETSEPTEVLDTVRTFARRRPAAFLIGSALAGVVVGRLSRSLAAGAKDAKADQAPALTGSGYATSAPATGYDTGAYTTGGYESGSYGTATTDTGYTTGTSYAGTETGTYDDTVTYADPDRGGITR